MLPIAQFVATLCCIVFAGAAIYVNLVEHPARMGCSTQIAATVWAPSYKRGTWMQAPLAIVSFLTGTASWLLGAGIGWLLLVTFTKLLGPRGARAVAAESLLLKHQLLISNRCRQRAPNLTTLDRFLIALTTLFVSPRRIPKLGALIKPATLFKFHKALVNRKYRLLFSSPSSRRRPGPKGPSAELIAAIIELKRRNPRFGCVRIAQQISYAFGVAIDKDVVRRVLAKHYRPGDSGTNGPSWLTFIGHVKDSLWSVDLFRCESILLHSHWALLVMDVCSRRVVGFGVERANIDGLSVCRMFNHAIAGQRLPKHVSTDHDPLFRFHRWLANLRVLAIV